LKELFGGIRQIYLQIRLVQNAVELQSKPTRLGRDNYRFDDIMRQSNGQARNSVARKTELAALRTYNSIHCAISFAWWVPPPSGRADD
jgi:hypothetical protein